MAYNEAEVIKLTTDILVKEEGFLGIAKPDPPAGKGINATKNPNDNAYAQYGIGIGHVITPEEYNRGFIDIGGGRKVNTSGIRGSTTTMTQEQATALLRKELPPRFLNPVKTILGTALLDKLNSTQIAACVSYAYNAGPGGPNSRSGFYAFFNNYGVKAAFEAGNYKLAGEIFRDRGVRTVQGGEVLQVLVERRKKEGEYISGEKLPPSTDIRPVINTDKYFDDVYLTTIKKSGGIQFAKAIEEKQVKYQSVVLQDKVKNDALINVTQLQSEIDFVRAVTGAGAAYAAEAKNIVSRVDALLPSEASFLVQYDLFEFSPDLMRQQMTANAGDGQNVDYSHAWRSPGKLAVTANITIPGACGFKIGQIFWVGRTYEHYKDYGAFQLFGLTENIDMSRGWTTELYARFNAMPKNKARLLKGV